MVSYKPLNTELGTGKERLHTHTYNMCVCVRVEREKITFKPNG